VHFLQSVSTYPNDCDPIQLIPNTAIVNARGTGAPQGECSVFISMNQQIRAAFPGGETVGSGRVCLSRPG
jgi:hypothetical protein